jgi:hypothetical protein
MRIMYIGAYLICGAFFACLFYLMLFGERIHVHWLEQHISDQQKQFAAIIKKYRDSYEATDDSALAAAYRSQRANAICNLFDASLSAVDWFGYVERISLMADDRVGLAVLLPTENNMPSQILFNGRNALISPTDSLYRTIINLYAARSHSHVLIFSEMGGWFRGQPLFFSGQFAPSTEDCLQAGGMSNAMTEPQWLFKFRSLRPFTPTYVPE